ncbi:18566_t:CDS:2 [Funneliformis geosporum]|uniref:10295_t:CDS:1 n=1 Tax=Funneliformis geosporum TaxID=1117311 RepID=A0A9W4SF27_9GLOM|nr:18566_t:CDS:2 [Funneliformis geosporum]CAI2166588.1 10295_t:CDS:2 [Funneliformis geosporum]
MTKGTLKAVVVEAKKLSDLDLIGKSDPYVKLVLDENKSQATTIKKDDLNPKYNEEFTFNTDGQKELKVEVWDRNTIGSDELIGSEVIPLNTVYTKGYHDTWIKIKAKKSDKRSHGEVHVILEYAV